MSEYTTKTISREEAEEMVRKARTKKADPVSMLTIDQLDRELHEYVYSGDYNDIVGYLYNYRIKEDR